MPAATRKFSRTLDNHAEYCTNCHKEYCTFHVNTMRSIAPSFGLHEEHCSREHDTEYCSVFRTRNVPPGRLWFSRKFENHSGPNQFERFQDNTAQHNTTLHNTTQHNTTPHHTTTHNNTTTTTTTQQQHNNTTTGGWSAQASDTYARIAIRRITNLQTLEIRTIMEHREDDPLGEDETILQLHALMETLAVPFAEPRFVL